MKIIFSIIILLAFTFNVFPANNSQALFEQGFEAFKSGNFGNSGLLFRKIIESGDNEYRDKAWYYLALSIFNQKKYQDAIFEFNRFISSCTATDLCLLSRYWIAESYFLLNDNIRAINEFNKYIDQSKNNEYIAQSYDRIGRIYFNQRRYDEAIIEWMKSLSKCEDLGRNNQKRLNIGEAYFLNENYDEAINFLLPILNSKVDSKTLSMAKLITGRAYQIKDKHLMAIKIFSGMDETLLTEKPYYDVQYYRALSYIATGNLNFAVLHLKTFLSTGKESKWIYYAKYELARLYIKDNNSKDAEDLLEQIRKSNADPSLKGRASMELARLYFDDNIEEAIKCLKEASKLESQQEKKEALLLLSKAYSKIRKFDEAESILVELVNNYSFDKNIDQIQFMLAIAYLEKGDFEKAKTGFNKIKEINPFSIYINEAYYYLAVSHLKNNQKDEAINHLNKYINLQKTEKKYDAYVLLLDIYKQKRDLKNAERTAAVLMNYYPREKGVENILYKYAKFLTDNGKSGKFIFDIILTRYGNSEPAGYILLSQGDDAFLKKEYKEAEYYYRQYLSVQWRENAASVYLYRIISLERLGMYKRIIWILNSGEKTPPMDDYTLKQLSLYKGRSYYYINDYKTAYDSYLEWKLVDLGEEDLFNIVKCSLRFDDILNAKKAADLIQKNINMHAEALYELSVYFVKKNDSENALVYLKRILAESPSSAYADTAKTEIAEINIKEEKYESAIQTLKEIKNEELQVRKNALLIVAYFRYGNEKEAIALTKKFLNIAAKAAYKEMVIKENFLYYFKIKDINLFNEYGGYLQSYPGNNLLINCMFARLNYNTNNYKTSYYYYYKLADVESEYKFEAIYYLGLISLLNNKDQNLAFKYFKRIADSSNPENKFSIHGKFDLAILSSELGNVALSKKLLSDIINSSDNRLLKIQAENLVEYFGYKD
ncbi:MAG: tetratricopeptide repeat protein [Spirochaetota bacterium]